MFSADWIGCRLVICVRDQRPHFAPDRIDVAQYRHQAQRVYVQRKGALDESSRRPFHPTWSIFNTIDDFCLVARKTSPSAWRHSECDSIFDAMVAQYQSLVN